jgi:hypothetical protein
VMLLYSQQIEATSPAWPLLVLVKHADKVVGRADPLERKVTH